MMWPVGDQMPCALEVMRRVSSTPAVREMTGRHQELWASSIKLTYFRYSRTKAVVTPDHLGRFYQGTDHPFASQDMILGSQILLECRSRCYFYIYIHIPA